MKMSEAFPSKYLKAADLQNRAMTLKMARVDVEDPSGKGEEAKPILYFQGKEKGLVLNKTNAGSITAGYGDESDDWIGKDIEIYPDTTMYQGQMVACIRVRIPVPKAEGDEEIPF